MPTGQDPLNNLMTNKKIAPVTAGFGATRVGDGKLFGVDGVRPIQGSVFTSIALDPEGVEHRYGRPTARCGNRVNRINRVSIKIQIDEFKVTVLNLNTDQIFDDQARQNRTRYRTDRLDCASGR